MFIDDIATFFAEVAG